MGEVGGVAEIELWFNVGFCVVEALAWLFPALSAMLILLIEGSCYKYCYETGLFLERGWKTANLRFLCLTLAVWLLDQ